VFFLWAPLGLNFGATNNDLNICKWLVSRINCQQNHSMSQITTHILDTTRGKPAPGITITLYLGQNDEWAEIARGKTNEDGRIVDLLKKDLLLQKGIYKLRFETKDYFDNNKVLTFYPYIEIIFDIQSHEHYHVPLLLNPFGYSTYRGS
jgi:5-hydroxyisourate hydrolase